jgi:hypothetical protein
MMKRWWMVSAIAVACGAGCNDDDHDAACSNDVCAMDCIAAGDSSGACVDNACQCEPAAPAPGMISGTALMFGHDASDPAHDHHGIAIRVVGTSSTATTAADGSYVIANVAPGAYTLSFTAAKFFDEQVPGVVVATTTTTTAPTITLKHGRLMGAVSTASAGAPPSAALYSPDRSHVLIEATTVEFPTTTSLDTIATDGTSEAAIHAYAPATFPPIPSTLGISNDSAVYGDAGSIWSRPVDASSPAHVLVPLPGAFGSQLQLLAVTGKFAMVRVTDSSKSPSDSFVVARTDGSSTAVAWTPTALAQLGAFIRAGDDYFVFFVSDNNGAASAIHAFDPNTGVDSVAPLTGLAGGNFTSLGPSVVSPDMQWVLLAGVQNGVDRTLLYHVGATSVAISPGISEFSGAGPRPEAMADSSGFMFVDSSATGGVWFWGTTVAPTPNPVQLITSASNNGTQGQPTHLYGAAVVYSDTADSNRLKIVSVPTAGSTTPTAYVLDTQTSQAFWQVNAAELDGVWAEGSPLQFKGVSIPLPITAAPSVATLGVPVSALCSSAIYQSRARVSLDGALFYYCPDSYTLSRFTPPFSGAPSATLVDSTVMSFQPLRLGGVAYSLQDGTWWTADGASKVLVSRTAASWTSFSEVASWLLFSDDSGLSRASRLDGTALDEPLMDCVLEATTSSGSPPADEPQPQLVGATVIAPTAECDGNMTDPYSIPQANLP